MPAPDFSVRVDRDELAKRDLAAGLSRTTVAASASDHPGPAPAHHGAKDERQAARGRSERDHARASGTGKSRSYAFRRS